MGSIKGPRHPMVDRPHLTKALPAPGADSPNLALSAVRDTQQSATPPLPCRPSTLGAIDRARVVGLRHYAIARSLARSTTHNPDPRPMA